MTATLAPPPLPAAVEDEARVVSPSLVTRATGAGLELLTYATQLDLPDPEAVLADPEGLELPERSDRLLAVLGSVTAAVAGNCTLDRWEAAWEVLGGAADAQRADVAAVAAAELLRLREQAWRPPAAVRSFLPLLTRAGLL